MKNSTKRRLYALLLAFILILGVMPTALLADSEDGVELTSLDLRDDNGEVHESAESEEDYAVTLEPDSSAATGGVRVNAIVNPPDAAGLRVSWSPTDSDVVGVDPQENDLLNHAAIIYGKKPGVQVITVTARADANSITKTIEATVSGIQLGKDLSAGIEIAENEMKQFNVGTDFILFGNANGSPTYRAYTINDKQNVHVEVTSAGVLIVEGREAGNATVVLEVTSGGSVYKAEFNVTVTSNEVIIPWTEGCSAAKPLKFSLLESKIAAACTEQTGQELASVIGLSVPTSEGTLYLGYQGPEDTGAGVGSSLTYYPSSAARGPYIKDITFVPNTSFSGEKATISFTGQTSGGRSFKGRIEVTLSDEKTDLVISTNRETPLRLTSAMFNKVCQEQVGSPLDYVIFTLPPDSQGTLYMDYKSEWDYASKVSANQQYKLNQLGNITFVPAPGYVGTVTVNYAGYSVSGAKYNGQLIIQVRQGLDDVIPYNDGGSGEVSFSRSDFDSFCENVTGRGVSSVSFSQLPVSQGTLYYNWNGSRGTAVKEGDSYTAAQIDRLTFVSANGFNGVVRIPFSGTDRSGEAFKGTVEIHIKTEDRGNGDINYVCAPGESVKLVLSDFAGLCENLTGQRLYYISFQQLPDFNQGALYHNRTSGGSMGTRVTTATKYFNSAPPYIMNLSFWATDKFRSVEIPFTGAAVSGETFTGILAISSGAGAGSGAAGTVSYSAIGQNPVQFSGADFDAACRQATNAALAYLQFGLPTSGQGILYYDYRAGSTPRALDPAATLYRTGEVSIDKVTFVPARGFSGIASVPFTGWAIDGRQFQGTVQISVQSATAMGGLVRYESRGEPVHINAYDVQIAAGGQPMSIRLTGLPPESQGKIYYQYNGPTQYSWMGNTSTIYTLYSDPSVSNLTFVPKAGVYGTVEIPYVASNTDGTQSNGTIRITVTDSFSSANFNDMDSCSVQTRSAVEYLAAMGVVLGTGNGKYEPGASIKRGDFCVMLSRAFQFDVGSTVQGFSDVPGSAYYAQAVNQMYALGVVNGVGGGRFDPSAPVSRQDASLMVQRALAQAGISAPDGNAAALAAYGDRSQVAAYAQGAVGGLAQLGIYPVTSSGELSPRANLTRADMALLLQRAMTQ